MQAKRAQFQMIKGMQQDNSIAAFNTQSQEKQIGTYTFENKNIRITPNEENTAWSISNEKGTLNLGIRLEGFPVGDCVADDKWIIFTVEEVFDADNKFTNTLTHIYILNNFDINITIKELYVGDLNMSKSNRLFTKFYYENTDIQKVYWVDGVNQCRFINVVASLTEQAKWKERKNPFDFVPELTLNEQVSVVKNIDSSGLFEPGTVQYFLTYLNKYGQESAIFYASPLLYTSTNGRAGAYSDNNDGSTNNICENSFTLTISNVQYEYDYIRVYSIARTGLDATPLAKKVVDLQIDKSTIVTEKTEQEIIKEHYEITSDIAQKQEADEITTLPQASMFIYTASSENEKHYNREEKYPRGNAPVFEASTYTRYLAFQSIAEKPDTPCNWQLCVTEDNKRSFLDTEQKNLQDIVVIECPKTKFKIQYANEEFGGNYFFKILVYNDTTNQYDIPFKLKCYPHSTIVHYDEKIKEVIKQILLPIQYTDTNTTGETIVPTDLYFLGGTPFAAKTLEEKDNTLFLGNITTKDFKISISQEQKQQIFELLHPSEGQSQKLNLDFKLNKSLQAEPNSDYPYKNSLNLTSYDFKTFKYKETYRLGIQFQTKYGVWSDVVYLDDVTNNVPLQTPIDTTPIIKTQDNVETEIGQLLDINGQILKWATPTLSIVAEAKKELVTLFTELYNYGFRKIRPVIVYPQYADSNCVMQGILAPTVYGLKKRFENNPYVQSSWFFRPNPGFKIKTKEVNIISDIQIRGAIRVEVDTTDAQNNKIWVKYNTKDPIIKDNSIIINDVYIPIEIEERYKLEIVRDENDFQYCVAFTASLKRPITLPATTIAPFEFRCAIRTTKRREDNDWQTINCKAYFVTYTVSKGSKEIINDQYKMDITDNTMYVNAGRFIEYRHNHSIPGLCGYIPDDNDADGGTAWKSSYNEKAMAELGNIALSPQTLLDLPPEKKIGGDVYDSSQAIDHYRDCYFIDQSIVTFHSPDLELNPRYQNFVGETLKLRIVGLAPLTYSTSKLEINADNPQTTQYFKEKGLNYSTSPLGFLESKTEFISKYLGGRLLVNGAFWADEISYRGNQSHSNINKYSTNFIVYPWQRTGSLSNSKNRITFPGNSEEQTKLAVQFPTMTGNLKTKILSNTRTSYSNYYLPEDIQYKYSNITLNIFKNNDVVSLLKVKDVYNSDQVEYNYYGNVDTIITPNTNTPYEQGNPSIFNSVVAEGQNRDTVIYVTGDGYPIMVYTGVKNIFDTTYYYPLTYSICNVLGTESDESYLWRQNRGLGWELQEGYSYTTDKWYYNNLAENTKDVSATSAHEGVSLKYKTPTHAVINLSYGQEKNILLPYLEINQDLATELNIQNQENHNLTKLEYGINFLNPRKSSREATSNTHTIPTIQMDKLINPFSYLWIAELYRENVTNQFGGKSEGALANNKWLPCGEGINLQVFINRINDNPDTAIIQWEEGDTYYQRYECLKTYPFNMSDQNQVLETVSFMCESKINLDGRYDLFTGSHNNLTAQPGINYNLINMAYSQTNNFFSYNYQESNSIDIDNNPCTICWSDTKVNGSVRDAWSNIQSVNTLQLSGDKGKLTFLGKVNNDIYCIQDKGISRLKYNDNIQISADNGLPIQLANSGKVSGVDYISNNIGCQNNQKIATVEDSIFFIDDDTKTLYNLNKGNQSGQVENVSTVSQFSTFFKTHEIKTLLYDEYLKDLYIQYFDNSYVQALIALNIAEREGNRVEQQIHPLMPPTEQFTTIYKENILSTRSLGFNCLLGAFTSLYSYGEMLGTHVFKGLPLSYISRKKSKKDITYLYQMYAGKYGNYFDIYDDYYVTFIVNPSPVNDKIFTNIEYASDVYNINNQVSYESMFDQLTIWNEYQKGIQSLKLENTPNSIAKLNSNLQQKFRVQRVNLPRHNTTQNGNAANLRARIRSPWVYLRLKGNLQKKAHLYNLDVIYYS